MHLGHDIGHFVLFHVARWGASSSFISLINKKYECNFETTINYDPTSYNEGYRGFNKQYLVNLSTKTKIYEGITII
jgi:hypothetical protein